VAAEPAAGGLLEFHRKNPEMVVWAFTIVEIESALSRRMRAGDLTTGGRRIADGLLLDIERRWALVVMIEPVIDRARRLLRVHPLGAADSLQLGAALAACDDKPKGAVFVSLDRRLAEAAAKEGFTVQP
jgi:hypothetical protein